MHSWLQHLMHEARVIELRHHAGDRWHSGTFDDIGALRAVISERQGKGNLFTTTNRVHDTVTASNAMGSAALADADIAQHRHLLFDFDPERADKGAPSDDDELAHAIDAQRSLMSRLLALGWPAPAAAISGNGAHLIYRVRLWCCEDTADMLATLYRGLRADCSTDRVQFDPTVRNPSRIWRLYGCENRKGTPAPNRPHRRALVTIPGRWDAVSPRKVAALADHYARALRPQQVMPAQARSGAMTGAGDYSTLDVCAWFAAHGGYRRPLGQGKHAVACPWTHEHSSEPHPGDTSTVCWEANGNWPTFHCSHAHCEGRSMRDVLALWADADSHCSRAWVKP